MTIPAQTPRSGPYTGDGGTVAFAYGFLIDVDSEIVVQVLDTVSGVITTKTLTTDYTVTGAGSTGGGDVTFVTAPTATEQVAILRDTVIDQGLDLQNRGSVVPQLLEDTYDELTKMVQDLDERVARGVTLDAFDTTDGTQFAADVTAAGANGAIAAAAAEDALQYANQALSGTYRFSSITTLLADNLLTYTEMSAGDVIETRADNFAYVVAASGATDHDVTTAAGLKLYVQPNSKRLFNIVAFGADDTGATDCTAEVQAAILAATSRSQKGIELPAGTFLIEQAGAFTLPTAGGSVNGFVFEGAGLGVTVVNFINSVGATAYTANYLAVNTDNDLRIMFRGIRFQGDGTNKNSSFYYMTSSGTAQSIRFEDVMWYEFAQIMQIEGASNASELLFANCKVSNTYELAYVVNNSQSLNHVFIGCDIESVRAGFFKFNAGGQLTVFGGSFICSDHPDGVVTNYLIDVDDDTGSFVGLNTWQFNFYGIRTEMNGSSQLLYNVSGARIMFDGCNLVIGGVTTRRVAYIGDKGRVHVRGGTVQGEWYLHADNASSWAEVWRPAYLMLEDADLRTGFTFIIQGLTLFGGADIANKGGVGRVALRNCRTVQASLVGEVLDADYGWEYGNTAQTAKKKVATIRHPARTGGLPEQTSAHTLILPLGAVITSVRVVHTAQAGVAGQVYTVKNGDGVVTHATATFDATDNYNTKVDTWHVGSDLNERTVVFTGDAGNIATSYSGYCVVEYIG